jgi:urease accessory protein
MLRFVRIADKLVETVTTLTLPLESRSKSRQRVTLDDGREAGLFLPRGSSLRDGDCLLAEDGTVVRVRAASETVSEVRCDDALQLARASYHLGNRHVALQIEPGLLRYQHDHVLDEMLQGLGLSVSVCKAPFEPEPGAYGGHGHTHNH